MNLFWSNNPAVPNWGDDINPFIFSELLKVPVNHVPSNHLNAHCVGIGSVLHHANKYSTILGTGFIQANDTFIEPPARIIAVRGKETRRELLRLGVSCPEVYGDVALLFPKVYYPPIKKDRLLGVIPHFIDKDRYEERIAGPHVKIIDIQNRDHFQFIRDILSCQMIASSSLHGMIMADAYGIPSAWLEFSDKVVGNGFKFRDYFSSVGTEGKRVIRMTDKTTLPEILDGFTEEKVQFDHDALFTAIRTII